MRKLRTSHPVVIIVFASRMHADMDSQNWTDLVGRLEAAKACCDRHHARLLAVFVSDELKELPLELTGTLNERFGLDECSLFSLLAISVDPNDPSVVQLANNDLKSIGHMILENAWSVHQEHGQRILLESSQRLQALPQATVLVTCKLGFLAEFQQDWTEAVAHYTAAYRQLVEVLRNSPHQVKSQLLLEALYVSEFITMKISVLLVHQQRSEEAWKQFHLHLSKFRIPAGALRLGLHAFFLGWLSRQYEIMLEIVNQRTGTSQNLLSISITSRRHLANLYFYSAEAAVRQRRHVSDTLKQLSAHKLPVYDFVVPADYWGQFKLKSDDVLKPVPEDVLDDYLLAVESNKDLQAQSLELLQTCLQNLRQSKVVRRAAHVSALLAEEQLAAGEVHAARENLLRVADTYRKDGWNHPLASALRLLIEISSESLWEKAVYSLELATLDDVADLAQRCSLAQSGVESLIAEQPELSYSKLWESDSMESELLPRRARVKGDVKDIGWSSVIEILCGFEAVHDINNDLHFGVALKNKLPVPLPLYALSVHFLEHRGHIRVIKFDDAPSTYLKTGKWKEFTTSFVPDVHGEMRVEFIEIRFGPQSSLTWHLRLSTKANSDQESAEEDHNERLPFKDSIICPGLHSVRVKHVGPTPSLTVVCPGDVYLGEAISVSIQVACEAKFEGECLRLDLSCDNSMGNPHWGANQSSVLEEREIQVTETEHWKRQHSVTVHSFGTVSIRATLELNSETVMVQCLSFEVKEPFFVESRVLSPPATYLYLPSPHDFKSDPLTPESAAARAVGPSTSISIAEGADAYVQVGVKCKADCELILLNAMYLADADSPLEVLEISGKACDVSMVRGDVYSMVFKIKPKASICTPYVSSLSLNWRRTKLLPLKQITTSLVEEPMTAEVTVSGEGSEAQTVCRLHTVTTQKPLLSVRCQPPGPVKTGCPFPYVVHLCNETILPEEFDVSVTESPGCLFSGDRANQVTIVPNQHQRIQWDCVAYTSGNVKLPKIRIASPRLRCFVEMEGMVIFVQPPSVQ